MNGDPLGVAKAGKIYNGQIATPSGPKEVKPEPETRSDLDRSRYDKDNDPQKK